MNIIHGAWVPENTQDFIQSGRFYLWVESDEVSSRLNNLVHPQHLQGQSCRDFLKNELAVSPVKEQGLVISLGLPTYQGQPLPSPELQHVKVDEPVTLQNWQVFAYPSPDPLKTITLWL